MSRILKVMIALLAIAAIATPVMAEDRLSLAGQMRVRGWHIDAGDNISDGDTATFGDQRFRLGGKLSVAEGVSITFRTDITESVWGTTGSGNGFGSGRSGANQQWDRAHIDLEKNNMHLRAGQQLIVLGGSGFDSQDNGLTFNLKGDIPFTVFYMMDNNGGSVFAQDSFWYGARVGHGTDLYAANLFAVNQNSGTNAFVGGNNEEDVWVIGATADFNFNPMKLKSEIEYFTGDANSDVDAVGFNLFLDLSMAVDEAMTFGGQFYYGMGTDKNDETQYTVLGNRFNGWDPLNEVGTGLSNEVITNGRPFNLATSAGVNTALVANGFDPVSTGVIGGRLYGLFKVSDALNLGGSVFYGVPEEDGDIKDFDSMLLLTAGASYALMENTKLDVQMQYQDVDLNDFDEVWSTGVGLFVNF